MSSVPAWVRRASDSPAGHRRIGFSHARSGARYIAASPHWLTMAHGIEEDLHEHVLLAASYFSLTATDDTNVPAVVAALYEDGTLEEIGRWDSGATWIAGDLMEAALSLDLAGRASTEDALTAVFRLLNRLGELSRPEEWYGFATRFSPWDAEIFDVLDARVVAAALDGPGGWQRVADLYEQGYRRVGPLLEALDAPSALSSGAL